MNTFNQETLEIYIKEEIEENLNLDYKSADSLKKTDQKKREITKDISAMANSAGGKIIYGIKEFDQPDKRHLPEKLDPVNRTQFSKEWLEQVINNIRPKIDNIIIYSVNIDGTPNHVVYVVEIPQSNTAHQATDYRYYKRYNFESVPMEDYEIRDVMHRVTSPDVIALFDFRSNSITSKMHVYLLQIRIINHGLQLVKYFKLIFTFPYIMNPVKSYFSVHDNLKLSFDNKTNEYIITYYSSKVLFPEEALDISDQIHCLYQIDDSNFSKIEQMQEAGKQLNIKWRLFADNMIPKSGQKSCFELHEF